jgi:hypothetical protein
MSTTQFLSRPLADVALDVEAYRADLEDEHRHIEEQRVKSGRGSHDKPQWRD